MKLSGSNGNDAIRMKFPMLRGDFEYGCTTTAGNSGQQRFGMAIWGKKSVKHFHSGNSNGNCAGSKTTDCFYCRFEQNWCSYGGTSSKRINIGSMNNDGTRFKFIRKSGEVCVYMNDAKKGCYSHKYTDDMYAAIHNDGGSSRNMKNCYYKSLVDDGVAKKDFPFATLRATSSSGSPATEYKIVSGSLPTGMQLSKSGKIYGQATGIEKQTKYTFSVQAFGEDDPVVQSFSLTVKHRMPFGTLYTDFSVSPSGSNSAHMFEYRGHCGSGDKRCEITGDTMGNIQLSGTNGNDAVIMKKPLLVGDFEYGCTTTSGTSSTQRFGMGLWDSASYSQFKSSNSAGYCAQANKGSCYFCRFEASRCSYRGSYDQVFAITMHADGLDFMFKREGDEICGYVQGKLSGCYSQKTTAPLYGAVMNDGGSSRNMRNCYWKLVSDDVNYV